jgi:hypothetical protein
MIPRRSRGQQTEDKPVRADRKGAAKREKTIENANVFNGYVV